MTDDSIALQRHFAADRRRGGGNPSLADLVIRVAALERAFRAHLDLKDCGPLDRGPAVILEEWAEEFDGRV